jgi:hypothetical protein
MIPGWGATAVQNGVFSLQYAGSCNLNEGDLFPCASVVWLFQSKVKTWFLRLAKIHSTWYAALASAISCSSTPGKGIGTPSSRQ